MATALVGELTEYKTLPVKTKQVTLHLTEDEAYTLALLTWKVGGSPDKSRRKDSDAIQEALKRAGIEVKWQGVCMPLRVKDTNVTMTGNGVRF